MINPTGFFLKKLLSIKKANKATMHGISDDRINEFLRVLGPKVSREDYDTDVFVKIAAVHLAELPDYYTRLKKMEEKGRAYWGLKGENDE